MQARGIVSFADFSCCSLSGTDRMSLIILLLFLLGWGGVIFKKPKTLLFQICSSNQYIHIDF